MRSGRVVAVELFPGTYDRLPNPLDGEAGYSDWFVEAPYCPNSLGYARGRTYAGSRPYIPLSAAKTKEQVENALDEMQAYCAFQ